MSNNVSVTINTNAKPTLSAFESLEQKLRRLKDAAFQNKEGTKKLGDGFKDLAKNMSGVQGITSKFSESLLGFAGGGPIAIAVGVGLAAITKGFKTLSDQQKQTKLSTEGVRDALADIAGQSLQNNYSKALLRMKSAEEALTAFNNRGGAGRLVTNLLGKNPEAEFKDAAAGLINAAAALNTELYGTKTGQTKEDEKTKTVKERAKVTMNLTRFGGASISV